MADSEIDKTYDLYCQVSSWLGIVDFYYAKHILGKLFWVTVILLGLILTLWQTTVLIRGFLGGSRFQTTISGSTSEDGIEFPNVTVCNYNRAMQSLINSDGISSETLSYLFHLFPVAYTNPLTKEQTNPNTTVYENAFQDLIEKNSSFADPKNFFRLYGHQFNQTILGLSANGVNLSRSMYYEPVFTAYGLCWKLVPSRSQIMIGSIGGLGLLIDPLVSEYMTDVWINNYLSEGIVLHVGYVFEPLFPIPYAVAPGSSVEMVLTASKHKITYPDIRIFEPVCQHNLNLAILDAEYSKSNCYYDCFLISLLRVCGCVTIASTKKPYPLCNLTSMFDCAYFLNDKDENLSICLNQCHQPCTDYRTLSAVMTTANSVSGPLQSLIYKAYYNNNSSTAYIESLVKSFISVNMYFGSPEIIETETTEATPLLTLIGNFGGVLGLWTGMSIVTIIQLVYYIIMSCIRGEIFFYKRDRLRTIVPSKLNEKNAVKTNKEELQN